MNRRGFGFLGNTEFEIVLALWVGAKHLTADSAAIAAVMTAAMTVVLPVLQVLEGW
jgi:hypothetical protein